MPGRSKCVFVVGGHETLAGAIRFNLEMASYRVFGVSTQQEAQLLLGRQRFDIAVIDHQLPEFDGVQFCRDLRSQPEHKRLPIILLSAFDSNDGSNRADEQHEAAIVLKKPFSPSQLMDIFDGCLA